MNTAITGAVTLTGLDPSQYSSLVFRADATQYKPGSFPEGSDFLGDDINSDITVDVDSSSETFTIRVFEPCDLSIYAHFELDISLSMEDPDPPGDLLTLATTTARFSMSRYLQQAVPTATPPSADAVGWMEPDPSESNMAVHGDWHQFRFRADISRYLGKNMGILGFSDTGGSLYASGTNPPDKTVKEVCEEGDTIPVNWRRAINQALTIGVCQAGEFTIRLRPYNSEVIQLGEYTFAVPGTQIEGPTPTSTPKPTSQRLATTGGGGGGGGGFGPAPVAPSFLDGFRAVREVAENTLPGGGVGEPVTASHPDGLAVEYSLSGTDAAHFDIDEESGQIVVGESTILDLTSGPTTYTVNVTATDTAGFGALIAVTIRVTEPALSPYDMDGNGTIDRSEVIAAVSDYFNGLIGKGDVIRLIQLYFAT